MDEDGLGREFRALRVAAGRTVASVAVDAGLSVPYIANLENGRGNPTIGALSRLAAALGRRLVVGLVGEPGERREPGEPTGSPAPSPADNSKKPKAAITASLGRFARTARFRHATEAIAAASGQDAAEVSAQLVGGLAGLAGALDRDLADGDWARLLDALLLVAVHPHGE
jgi:transcriptional regulator with XRE-family HTH domain